MGYDGELAFNTKIDESGFNSGIGRLGSLAKNGLAVLGTAIVGVATSFGVLTKASLDSVASLEQNIGGVETLFKDSADTVIASAKRAYETAGMSANDYMSTITSFSASLLQSLNQDTKKAASYADRAIVDMSDNANKMGTSIELIQNAYQGFAKQNYTMLDNLKLGYGGTAGEMARLINDTGLLNEKLPETGKGINEAIQAAGGFALVTEAIHVIQEEMGITGTTAKEAATTIEGSMNSAKAAWDNFLNGTASVDELVVAFETAGNVIADNLEQIVPRLVETIPAVVKALIPIIKTIGTSLALEGLEIIKDLAYGIESGAPEVLEKGKVIVERLITGIQEAAPLITKNAGEIAEQLFTFIQENAPKMIETGAQLLSAFVEGIAKQLPSLIPKALEMVVTIADSVISNLPTIINAGISLLKGLAQGIIDSLPILISEGPRIINDFADAIYSGLWNLVTTGLEMLRSLIKGLWDNRELLLDNAYEIFLAFINVFSLSNLFSLGKKLLTNIAGGIKNMLPNMSSAEKNIITNLVNGIKSMVTHPVSTIKTVIKNIKTTFTNIKWADVGKNILKGIANGLKNGAGAIVDAAKDAAKSALNAAKKFLGIKSPSRKFRDEVGKMMAFGLGEGFEKNIPDKEMQDSINASIKKIRYQTAKITTSNSGIGAELSARSTQKLDVGNKDGWIEKLAEEVMGPVIETVGNSKKELVIHTHVNLDKKEVGNSITRVVDKNFADEADLKERGN